MDAILESRLSYELRMLNDARSKYSNQLKMLKQFDNHNLKMDTSKYGHNYYSAKKKNAKRFGYVGTAEHETVRGIMEVHHLKEAIKQLDNNIKLIKNLRDGYVPCDLLTIDNLLPKAYRNCLPLIDDKYHSLGKKWKADKLKFQANFPENFPDFKSHHTLDKTLVKSVSEVNLYNTLLLEGLIFVYELPLASKDYGPPYYPDFTILSPVDLKTEIIVEYVGRLDMKSYREDFADRIYRYMRNGYIPGVNLFFVFADLDGNVDSLQISKVIADIKGLR
ncbi:MAG: hypothetical protein IJI11_00550 [Mogibacterium sp.]|nr:hypothetical protein [Mogibacterium sp.]